MSIKTLSTRLVFENRWLKLREDAIQRADGSIGTYSVVEKADFAAIIPLEDNGMHLVEQFRYPVSARFWELPQGSLEHDPKAEPIEIAKTELLEETGMTATSMTQIGHLYEAYGFSSQACHVFLATGLTQGESRREPEETDLISRFFTFAEIKEMIEAGSIKDSVTLAALGLLQIKGRVSF